MNNRFRRIFASVIARGGGAVDPYADLVIVDPTVTILQTSATAISVFMPIPGETSKTTKARVSLLKTNAPNLSWCMDEYDVYSYPEKVLVQDITPTGSAFEFAYNIGADADLLADYDFYSNSSAHNSVILQSVVIKVDGVETTLVTNTPVTGASVTIEQTMNIIYPKDDTTVIGTVALTHSFVGATGILTVSHAHTYDPGYKLYRAYSGMLPTSNAGITKVSIGNAAEYTTGVADDSAHFNTQSRTSYGRSDLHSYRPQLMLPFGGPDILANWQKAAPDYFWFQDRIGGLGKFYVNWVGNTFANRVTAIDSSHASEYRIVKTGNTTGIVATRSAFIDSGATTANNGQNIIMDVGEYNAAARIWRSLLYFDLSTIPASATITSATLSVNLSKAGTTFATNNCTMKAHRVLRAWTEGDRNGAVDSPATGTTWARYDAANNWGTAGCSNTTTDRETAELGSVVLATTDALYAQKDMTLDIALVQGWVDGSFANNGLLLKSETESDDAFQIYSRHAPGVQFAPRLVIEYTQ